MATPDTRTKSRKPMISIIVIVAIILLFVGLINVMPKGFKTTHEEIGQGIPAMVFVYDPNLTVSNSQTEQMNAARAELGDEALFLLARVGSPDGQKFMSQYRAGSAEILVFDANGELIKRHYAVTDAGQLVQWLTL
ncbi:hypothetical protein [Shewanella gaetbuli]|uniref:Uncharacterized protein n=1 Tax=Shewanella gaetbuli TaxID=220752 RepID=A0A9X1ZMC6_9GAMM|nr:hypothetical protein [Shewanella gaetbuli]MCL1142135.1 hypothetical protein [Shewanella gaetbuli]